MGAVICLLRGVNVGGHKKIRMDALRGLCVSLKLREPQTYVQSGNVVFGSEERDLAVLAGQVGGGVEGICGFRPEVIVRTTAALRDVVARNPFTKRSGIEPSRLLVMFLAGDPSPEAREKVLRMDGGPEELRISGRELYIYFPNGLARPKLSPALIEKTLKTPATGRNWNTVTKLLEMAERLDANC